MADLAVSGVSRIAPICIEVTCGEIRAERNSKDCDPNHKIPLIRDQNYRDLEPQTLLININMVYSIHTQYTIQLIGPCVLRL